ncbi:MAG: NAD(P)H-binding protein [Acidobacteria bacterium]|nr:NAD(P)H-binding protein [Acidobacteriota bacterium]MBS1864429.1 NAD(P)H-binding protein [Acidobacteriota bacterium]
MRPILVIGGTGTVGRQVVLQLLQRGARVRVLARNPEKAQFPPRVEVVHGDLTVPYTLDAALDGAGAVFLVWVAPPSAAIPALEKITKKAGKIAFLSAPLKTPHPLFQQPNLARSLALQIEQFIASSGTPWTFLRPGMFAANAIEWWGEQIRGSDPIRWPYLSVPTAPIDELDIAAIAARALTEDGHDGAEYVITGPQSLTQFEQISLIGSVVERSLHIEELSPEDARRELLPAFPRPVVNMLLEAWAAASGQPAFVSSTFQQIMGRAPRTLLQWAKDNVKSFQP